ncbi:MAG: AMP-dependent synthetase/ligase [Promethearchaeota archaeon]
MKMLRVYDSIGELLDQVAAIHGSRPFIEWRGVVGERHSLTFDEVRELAKSVAAGLASLGVKKGDRVAIFSETRAEWIWSDLGCLWLGAVVVTIYPSLTAKQVHYILNDSGARAVFVDTRENLEKLLAVWCMLPQVEHAFAFDEVTEKELVALEAKPGTVHGVGWLVDRGKEKLEREAGFAEAALEEVHENDLASIIYTSGTTGVPKGVMLTHRNFLSNAITSSEVIKAIEPKIKPHEQNSLTFMPLSHSYCRTAEEFLALYNGGRLCLAGGRSPSIIETGFKVFKPTLMAGIPYVFEKVRARIFSKVDEYPPRVRAIFYKALEFGKAYNEVVARGEKPPLKWRLKHWLFDKLVYRTVRKELGGRLLAFVSGSARLPPEIVVTFWALGIRIADGYGLTEAAPVTHVMRAWENSDFRPNWPKGKKIHPLAKLGSVGPPIEFPANPYPNVEAKIAEDGELLVRGPNVMAGYWNKPEETAEVLDDEGWLHTGDLGRIDEDGYLYITGRKKVIIKLSTGKMVSPAYVEEKLISSPLILQVVLVGSERKFLTAFLVPDQNGVRSLAEREGIPHESYQDLLRDERVLSAIKREVLERSRDLAAFETVKKFAVFAQEFNEEEGYLTPTLKYKRNRILRDFADVVDELYRTDADWVVVERRLVDFHALTIPG